MAIKQYNPTTPGRRGMSSQDFDVITTKKPLRSLLVTKRRGNGRNNQGRITTRHQGGGARKFYRLVNFNFKGEGVIEHIEYDPNRSARIARVKEANGTYHYVLAAKDMQVGQKLVAHEEAPIESGNRLPLRNIPVGTTIHAIELQPGKGAQMVRSMVSARFFFVGHGPRSASPTSMGSKIVARAASRVRPMIFRRVILDSSTTLSSSVSM